MKKILFLLILLCIVKLSNACPICGCGVGGFYMGTLPNFKNGFVGVRYQYSHYTTHLADEPDEFSIDDYQIAELWGGISLGSRWQVLGFVPYHFNSQHTDDGLQTKNGLGDITVLANYKLWQSTALTRHHQQLKQEFWIGAGAKLPTGTYDVDLASPDAELGDVNSQMGTGSVDFIANAMYNIHVGNWGVNTTVNYKVNTTNNSDFKFGNRFSGNSIAYYTLKAGNTFISPNAGILFEQASINHLEKSSVEETGGYVALASGGAEVSVGSIIIGASAQLPFAQDYAHGQTVAKARCLVHVTLSL